MSLLDFSIKIKDFFFGQRVRIQQVDGIVIHAHQDVLPVTRETDIIGIANTHNIDEL
jgi:hypothetical protein